MNNQFMYQTDDSVSIKVIKIFTRYYESEAN